MTKVLRGFVLALGLLGLGFLPGTARSFEPAKVREAAAAVYEGRDYQQTLPLAEGAGSGGGRESDQEGEAGARGPEMKAGKPFLWRLPAEWAEVLRIVVYLVVGVGALLLIYYLLMELPALRRARRQARSAPVSEFDPAFAQTRSRLEDSATLEEADRLAQAGRFAEAIHMLLLHALEVLRARLESGLPQALTSREILRQAPLPPTASPPLSALIERSERCHFGTEGADQELYRQSRGYFEAFRAVWRGTEGEDRAEGKVTP